MAFPYLNLVHPVVPNHDAPAFFLDGAGWHQAI